MGWLESITVGQVLLSIAALGALWVGLRPVRKAVGALREFGEDWAGQPARPGRDRVPGVIEQITLLGKGVDEAKMAALSADYNSRPNGGGSAYDRMSEQLTGISDQLGTYGQQLAEAREQLEASIADRADLHQQLDAIAAHQDQHITQHITQQDGATEEQT